MPTVISGNGLGLFNSSLSQLNGYGGQGNAKIGWGGDRVYVNASTGNLVIQSQDDYLASLGLDVAMVRTYNSLGLVDGDNGDNWQTSLYRRLLNLPSGGATTPITRINGDGHQAVFTYDAGKGYWISSDGAGAHDTLKLISGQWIFEDTSNGVQETYDSSGKLLSATDRDGKALTYGYTGNLITSVTDASGETLYLDYSGNNLTQVRVVTGSTTTTRVRYAYDGQNRLIQVKVDLGNITDGTADDLDADPNNKTYVTQYEYSGSSDRITRITQSDGSELKIGYVLAGSDYRVASLQQLSSTGVYRTTTFNYDTANRRTDVYDGLGQVTQYTYDTQQRLTRVVLPQNETGALTVLDYAYNAEGDIIQAKTTVGAGQTRAVDFQYSNGNLIESRDNLGNTIRRTYNAADQIETETRYTVPDPDGAGSGQPSGAQTTRYLYDAQQHLRFVLTPEGRVTQNQYNANGQLVSTIRYTGQLYTTATYTETALNGWAAGLADKTQGERVDFTYDARGQLATSTRYTSLTGTGAGNATGAATTTYVYSAAGQLLQAIDPRNASYSTTYTYDGLGRTLTITDATGRLTASSYDDANNRIVTTSDKVGSAYRVQTTSVYNKAGDLISQARADSAGTNLGSVSYAYDANGRLRMLTDETGQRSFLVYDEQGRKVGEVSAEGVLTETVYNAAGQVIRTTRYAGRVSAGSLVDGSGVPKDVALSQLRGVAAEVVGRPTLDLNGAATGTAYSATFTENGPAVAVVDPSALTLSDNNNANLAGATVTITNAKDVGNEILSVNTALATSYGIAITTAFSGSVVTLTFSGSATVAQYQALLRTLKYEANAQEPTTGARDIRITVSDGDASSLVATSTVTVAAANDAPIVDANGPGYIGTDYAIVSPLLGSPLLNGSINIGSAITVVDSDSLTLPGSAVIVSGGGLDALLETLSVTTTGTTVTANYSGGTLTLTGPASPADFQTVLRTLTYSRLLSGVLMSTRTIQITVSDGIATSAPATVTILAPFSTVPPLTPTPPDSSSPAMDGPWAPLYFSSFGAGITTAASISDAGNRGSYFIYDAAGRNVFTLTDDTEGLGISGITRLSIVETVYDGAGRIVKTTAYATRLLTTVTLGESAIRAALVADGANDRTTRFFYSDDGLLLGQLDADGYLSENVFDAGGRLTQTIRYATLTNSSFWAGGTLSQLRPATSPTLDQTAYRYYDAQGRLSGTLDAMGYVTTYAYDLANNKTSEARYSGASAYNASLATVVGSASAATPGGQPVSRSQSWSYDALGRVSTQTNAEGTISSYNYDPVNGFLTSVTTASGTDPRTTTNRYDALGRVTQAIEGEGSAALAAAGGNTVAQEQAWNAYATKYLYDLAGRLVKTTDPNGNATLYYYNGDGQLRYTVRAALTVSGVIQGEVTEFVYNAFNEVTSTIQYANRLAMSGLTGGVIAALLPGLVADTAKDRKTTVDFSKRGLAIKTTDAVGFVTQSEYTAFGQLKQQQKDYVPVFGVTGYTRLDNWTYDRTGDLKTSTLATVGVGAVNQAQSYVNDAFGRQTQRTDGRGNIWKTDYDRLGRVIQTTDPLTQTVKTEYDAFSRTTKVYDLLGNATTYAYDDTNRTLTITTPESVVTTRTHNRHGDEISVSLPNGSVTETTTFVYDLDGRLTSTVVDPGAGRLNITTGNEYDKAGLLKATLDAKGVRTAYTYDAASRVLSRTVDPINYTKPDGTVVSNPSGLNLTTQYSYSAFGDGIQVIDAKGVITETVYDQKGRQTAIIVDTANLKIATVYDYDAGTNVLQRREGVKAVAITGGWNVTGAALKTTLYQYDQLGRNVLEGVDPGNGNTAVYTGRLFDASGNVWGKSGGGADWRFVYDASNRLIYTISPGGTASDPKYSVTETRYDAAGRVVGTLRYANTLTLLQLSSINGSTTPTQLAAMIVPSSGVDQLTQSVYDKDGRLAYVIDAVGGVTGFQYDAVGRVVDTIRYASGVVLAFLPVNPTVADVQNLLHPGVNDQHARTVYDAAGRAAYEIDALGQLVQNSYDAAGNRLQSRAYAKALSGSITYTQAGIGSAITSLSLKNDNADRLTTWVYDAADRQRFELRTKSTVGGVDTVYVTEQRYDNLGRVEHTYRYDNPMAVTSGVQPTLAALASLVAGNLDPANDQHEQNVYDAAGRLSQIVDGAGYTQSYVYDELGNKKTYTNQNGATWTYTYDLAGRLLTETTPQVQVASAVQPPSQPTLTNKQIVTYFLYDGLNNLTARIENFGTPAESRVTTYTYDVGGRQLVTRDGDRITLGGITYGRYAGVYDAAGDASAGYISRHEASTAALTRTVTFDAFGNAIIMRDAGGRYSYKVYDILGRVRFEIDADGYLTHYSYDLFGRQVSMQRYANPATPGHVAGTAYTALEVTTRFAGSGADRYVSTSYDLLDRKSSVIQRAVYSYDASSQTYVTASPTTNFQYNAFGDEKQKSTLRSVVGVVSNFDSTYSYYDRLGNKVAQVDPMGYLTQWDYTATGQVANVKEWANALTPGSWDVTGVVIPATPGTTAASVTGPAPATYWQSAFASGSNAGLSGNFINNFTLSGGQLVVKSQTGGSALEVVNGTRSYNHGSNDPSRYRFTFDFTYGSGSLAGAGRYIGVGNWSGSAKTASTFGLYLSISSTAVTVMQLDGLNTYNGGTIPLTAGLQYRLEIVTDARGATLYVYPASAPRGTGLSYRLDTTLVPTNFRTQLFAQQTTSSALERLLNISQITESNGNESTLSAAGMAGRNTANARETQFEYDRLGRQTKKIDVGVVNTNLDTDGRVISSVGNQTTLTQYDGVGNVIAVTDPEQYETDATRPSALYFYNALGQRIVAVTKQDAVFSRLTSYAYDSLGNTALQYQYVNGTTRQTAQTSLADLPGAVLVDAARDAVTYLYYDVLGRSITTVDAESGRVDVSYDAYGNVAKTEQSFARLDGTTGRKIQVYTYDGRGQQTRETRRLESGAAAHYDTAYNAFGEVTAKSFSGGDAQDAGLIGTYETYRYDAAGRLAYGNVGGVGSAYLYDLEGQSTATLRSPAIDLGAFFNPTFNPGASASSVVALSSGVRRTETVYDVNGRAIQEREASFTQKPAQEMLNRLSTSYNVTTSTTSIFLSSLDGATATLQIQAPNSTTWTNVPLTASATTGLWTGTVVGAVPGEYQYKVAYTLPGQSIPFVQQNASTRLVPITTAAPLSVVARNITVNGVSVPYYVFKSTNAGFSLTGMTAIDLLTQRVVAGDMTYPVVGSVRYAVVNSATPGVSGLLAGEYGVPVVDNHQIVQATPIGAASYGRATFSNFSATPTATSSALALIAALYGSKLPLTAIPTSIASNIKFASFQYKPGGSGSEQSYLTPTLPSTLATDVSLVTFLHLDPLPAVDFKVRFTRADGTAINFSQILVDGQPIGDANGYLYGTYVTSSSASTLAPWLTNNAFDISTDYPSMTYSPTSAQTVDRWGNILTQTDATGIITRFRYDEFNRVIEQTQAAAPIATNRGTSTAPVESKSQVAYDGNGRVIGSTDANGNLTNAFYNAAGDRVLEIDGARALTGYGYSLLGAKTTVTRNNNSTVFSYDRLGRLVRRNDPAKATDTTWAYDALGNLVNDNGRITYTYDGFGRVLTQTQLAYTNLDGQARQQKTTSIYDALGNKVKQTDNLNNFFSWTYNNQGQLKSSTGLSTGVTAGPTTQYSYDYAGQKTAEWITIGGVSYAKNYRYYENGLLASVFDSGRNEASQYIAANSGAIVQPGRTSRTDYAYDAAGRLTHQRFTHWIQRYIVQGSVPTGSWSTAQDTVYQYDAQGRLSTVMDTNRKTIYGYDAAGNRKLVTVTGTNPLGGLLNNLEQRYRYDYDGNNRVQNAIESAVNYNSSGVATALLRAKATVLQYDASGNRVLEQDFDQGTTTISLPGGAADIYTALGQFEQPTAPRQVQYTHSFDADNRLTQTLKNGIINSARLYDDFNQARRYEGYNDSGTRTVLQENTYYVDGTLSQVVTLTGTNRYIYDNAGNLSIVRLLKTNGSSAGTYTYTNVSGNQGYQNTQIVANANGRNNTTVQGYDFRGNLTMAWVTGSDQTSTQLLTRDADGLILRKYAPYATDQYNDQLIYQGSNLLGIYGVDSINGQLTQAPNFGVDLPTVSDQYPAVSPGQYVVQDGDTLRSIAQVVYGDSSLWYVIADANAVQQSTTLVPGTVLKLPNQVLSAKNNSSTFKPYNPAEIIGDTNPALPPPPKKKCNAFAAVLVAVVAVVVTVYSAGVAASAFGATATATGAGSAAAAGTFSAGAAVLSGSAGFGAGALGAAAVGGAAGSIASQAVAIGLGQQDDFSFSQVAIGALSAAATAGVGAGLGVAGQGSASLLGSAARAVASTPTAIQGFTQGALTAIANAGVNVAVTGQSNFSWANVAAAALTAGTARGTTGFNPLAPYLNSEATRFSLARVAAQTVQGAVFNVAQQEIAMALGARGKVDLKMVLADSFGNALGNSIVGAIRAGSSDARLERNGTSLNGTRGNLGGNVTGVTLPNGETVAIGGLEPGTEFTDSSGNTFFVDDAGNPQYVGLTNGAPPTPSSTPTASAVNGGRGTASSNAEVARLNQDQSELAASSGGPAFEVNKAYPGEEYVLPPITSQTAQPDLGPNFDFLTASMALRRQQDEEAQLQRTYELTRGAEMRAYDPAISAARTARARNDLAIALGGPIIAGPMAMSRTLGATEAQVDAVGRATAPLILALAGGRPSPVRGAVAGELRLVDPAGNVVTRGYGGRFEVASGVIKPSDIGTGTPTNPASRAFARSQGLPGDDAGHARGNLLGGPGSVSGGLIFPQRPAVNRGDYAQFEQLIANEVRATGNSAYYDIRGVYDSPFSTRPIGIRYSASISGQQYNEFFPN